MINDGKAFTALLAMPIRSTRLSCESRAIAEREEKERAIRESYEESDRQEREFYERRFYGYPGPQSQRDRMQREQLARYYEQEMLQQRPRRNVREAAVEQELRARKQQQQKAQQQQRMAFASQQRRLLAKGLKGGY